MKVLVLGASGFIGLPVAQALSRAGHVVYGLTRSAAKAKQLAAEEIIPIVGDPDSDLWHKLIPTLDIVIFAVGGAADIPTLSGTTLRAVSKAAQDTRPPHAPKISYIHSSGTWVHGENRRDIVNDTTPITNPAELVSWLPAHEQLVIHDPVLNGIVIRSAMLYGRSGSLLAGLFKSASHGKVAWPGTPGGRLTLVHADDLADLYVRVAEKAPLVGGQIFDAANDSTESTDEFLQRLVEVSGARGPYEYTKPTNLFEIALSTTTLVRPYLARGLLGWSPKKPGLIDGLELYYSAYLATQDTAA